MIVIEERKICRMLEGLFQFDKECEWNDAIEEAMHRFVNLPTIEAVEVVRCKDCDWWDRIDDGPYGYCHSCKHGFYSANWEISIYRRYKEDFFCADGERRTDE